METKEVLLELIQLIKEEIAEIHIDNSCGFDYNEDTCISCEDYKKCSRSKRLYDKLIGMEEKLNSINNQKE